MSGISVNRSRLRAGIALSALVAGLSLFGTAWGAETKLQPDTTVQAKGDGKTEETKDISSVSTKVDEVVVTARRRKEKSQDVPVAITAISGKKLENEGVNNIREVFKQVPSVQVTVPNTRNTSLNIRGIGSSIANDGLENSVGVFVDGVYYARPGSATFDLLDVESFEVLRGPQGTLFGKNTTAGAFNITTLKPSFQPSYKGEVSVGDYGFAQLRGSATGPLSDVLAYRASFSGTKRDGFITNTKPGGGDDIDDFNDLSFRGQLLYVPTDDFSFRLIGDYSRERLHCCVGLLKEVATTRSDGSPWPNGFYSRAALFPGYTPPTQDPFARESDINTQLFTRTSQAGVSGEATWDVLGHTLTSITSYRKWSFEPSNDWDYIGLDIIPRSNSYSKQEQFSQEFRIASPSDQRIEYVLGTYYFWQFLKTDNYTGFGSDALRWLAPGQAFAAVPGILDGIAPGLTEAALNNVDGVQHTEPKTQSLAGFGQATWHATTRVDLTGGLRYTYEKKSTALVQYQQGGVPLSTFGGLAGTIGAIRNALAPTSSFSKDYNEGNLSGGISVSYKFTPDILSYLSYSRGYKSGGINVTAVPPGASSDIEAETADSYELGVKSEYFNNRLRFNTALFWADIGNYQANAAKYIGATGYNYIANVGKVRTRGVEFDAQAVPVKGLTLIAAGAYTDAEYVSYKNSPCQFESYNLGVCDLSGATVPGLSPWSGYVSAEYVAPLGGIVSQELLGYVSADYSYRSTSYSGVSEYLKVPAYGVANGRVGLRLADQSTDVSFWVKNVLDEEYYTAVGALPANVGATAGFVGAPRTLGVTLRQTF